MADALASGASGKPCRFKSCHLHHKPYVWRFFINILTHIKELLRKIRVIIEFLNKRKNLQIIICPFYFDNIKFNVILYFRSNMIKTVIFDFDDTLYSDINPKPWRDFCLNTIEYFLSSNSNYSTIKKEIENKSFSDRQLNNFLEAHGINKKEIFKYLKTHHPIGSTFENCTSTSNKTLAEFAKHFKLFIVSNSTKESVLNNMVLLNIDHKFFEDIISNPYNGDGGGQKDLYIKKSLMNSIFLQMNF